MCMCGKPVINGEPGYSWNGEPPHVRQPHPPTLHEDDTLIFDEPGRCGGLDSHSHHFRLVKQYSFHYLLVRHGGGEERIRLGCSASLLVKNGTLHDLDTHRRYWLLHAIHSAHRDAVQEGRDAERKRWSTAAAEKRIKTRKQRGGQHVKVWIEPAKQEAYA